MTGAPMPAAVRVRVLDARDAALVAAIDRSEDVAVEYAVVDGELVERTARISTIAPWDPAGTGHHSVAEEAAFVAGHLAAGATLLGAFVDVGDTGSGRVVEAAAGPAAASGVVDPEGLSDLAGLAVIQPRFDGDRAQLAFLHVGRRHRRHGAASALWVASLEIARAAGATTLYVSATPTGSAIGFYRQQGCRLARPPHPVLFAAEPDDIHLVVAIGS